MTTMTHHPNNLYAAAAAGHLKAVQALLKHGADPDTPALARYGDTPLLAAARFGHLEVVQALLDAGADPHIENRYGDTPRRYAEERGNYAMLQALHHRP